MSSTLSPNMNLPVPGVGTEPGPQYATDVNNSLGVIDQHNHSPGQGVLIGPNGLNINTTLTYNNNAATNLAGLNLIPQVSEPAINTIYESGVDLYYVDGLGNNIRLTQSGGVAGSPGSISDLTPPASASYVSANMTFVWQSGTSIAANLDAGSILLRNLSPNSTYALTLSPPAALTSNYTLTLPNLPVVQSFLTLDTAGNISSYAPVSGGLTGANLSPTAGITGGQLANATINQSNLSSATTTTGSPSGLGYTNASTTFTTICSCTVTAIAGRPNFIQFSGAAVDYGYLGANGPFNGSPVCANFQVVRGPLPGTVITQGAVQVDAEGTGGQGTGANVPVSIMNCMDFTAAGSVTYYLQGAASILSGSGYDIAVAGNVQMTVIQF